MNKKTPSPEGTLKKQPRRRSTDPAGRILLAFLALLIVSSCTNSTTPVPPARKFADSVTRAFPSDVRALCYGNVVNDIEDIRYDALQSCPEGTQNISILDQDSFWTPCPALQPVRITYQCLK